MPDEQPDLTVRARAGAPRRWREPEQAIRARLGVPPPASYVLVVDQAAHMDWDWTSTFQEYFTVDPPPPPNPPPLMGSVHQLLTDAMRLVGRGPGPTPQRYSYSVCEIGFFREFVNTQRSAGIDIDAQIRAAGDALRIVGGGITSPDCLLCSGEGFLRNYLRGKLWLQANFPELLPLRHCWIPDDFGQDPELPVAVAALGMQTIGFSRLPGLAPGNTQHSGPSDALLSSGVDFWWSASDGRSTVFTHWMPGAPGYFQGKDLQSSGGKEAAVVAAISGFLSQYKVGKPTDWRPPYPGAPSEYLYLPLDDDFMLPVADLLSWIDVWNSSDGGGQAGVHAVAGSFDDFAALVLASQASLPVRRYVGAPYWTGYYMSRPGIKVLHYGATRALLAAEVFGLLAHGGPAGVGEHGEYWSAVAQAWDQFVPSTHHDYVCGTAPDSVTQSEQLPLLQEAYAAAASAASAAVQVLATSVGRPGDVVVANPVGVAYSGPVELAELPPEGTRSVSTGGVGSPVQLTATGAVFLASIPSMGYATGTFSPDPVTLPGAATVEPALDGSPAYTLRNEHLTVVVDAVAGWAISSLTDATGASLLADGGIGNDLAFYRDQGNIYQFGNELSQASADDWRLEAVSVSSSGDADGATVVESGPVRVTVRTVVSVTVANSAPLSFVREYSLAAGEHALRMTTTGSAPAGYSVMAAFRLAAPVDSLTHGTPCHWTSTQPLPLWSPPIFQATHDFVLPAADGRVLAAVYHPEVPAWAVGATGELLGCLLRNTPACGRGAHGSDDGTHTLRYALRSPAGLGSPETGEPSAEALRCWADVTAALAAPGEGKRLLSSGSVAAVSSPGVVQAAKPGDVTAGALVLRLYSPANAPQRLSVELGRQPAWVRPVTSLEDNLVVNVPEIQLTLGGFEIDVSSALTTVAVSAD